MEDATKSEISPQRQPLSDSRSEPILQVNPRTPSSEQRRVSGHRADPYTYSKPPQIPKRWHCPDCTWFNDDKHYNCLRCNSSRTKRSLQWRCSSCSWHNRRSGSRCNKCNSFNTDEVQLAENAKHWKIRYSKSREQPAFNYRQALDSNESAEAQRRRLQEQRLEADRAERLEKAKGAHFVGFERSNAADDPVPSAGEAAKPHGRPEPGRSENKQEPAAPISSNSLAGPGSSRSETRNIQLQHRQQPDQKQPPTQAPVPNTKQSQVASRPITVPDVRPSYLSSAYEPAWPQSETSRAPGSSTPDFGTGWGSYKSEELTLSDAERDQRPAAVVRASPPPTEEVSHRYRTSDVVTDGTKARLSEQQDSPIRASGRKRSEFSADISWLDSTSSTPASTAPVSRRRNIDEAYGEISWLEATSPTPSSRDEPSPKYAEKDTYTPAYSVQDASSKDPPQEVVVNGAASRNSQSPAPTTQPATRQRSGGKPYIARDALGDIEFAPSTKRARTESSSYAPGRALRRPRHVREAMEEYDDELDEDVEEKRQRRRAQRKKEKAMQKNKLPPTPIYLPEFISVSNLARVLKVRVEDFARKMQDLGFDETNSDHVVDAEVAGLIAAEFNFEAMVDTASEGQDLQARPPAEDKAVLPPRPPIVTIMGHVDHGKTTLLDYLRKSSVAASEHGGITQHIGAFSVSMPGGRSITFLDTPGHAAFLSMRQRGATVTDVVILVVAADDSVKPQTIEAIKHAQAAKVPMIVAINKVDKEDKNIDRVKGDLARYGVEIEDYGGDTQVVQVSGKTGAGLDTLEEAIVAQADIIDMRAQVDGPSEGWILEATTKKGGRVATVLVRRGTIRKGDIIVAGSTWARIRTLKDAAGVQVMQAGPGIPVEVDGWKDQPVAGDEVLQAESEQQAKSAVAFRLVRAEKERLATDMAAVNESRRLEQEKREAAAATSDNASSTDAEVPPAAASTAAESKAAPPSAQDTTVRLPLILKADVSGSVEACLNTITALGNSQIHAQVLRSSVGPVSESDLDLASSSSALIVNFNQTTTPEMQSLASRMDVTLLEESIIYRLTDAVKAKLEALLPSKIETRVLGEAEVAQRFEIGVGGRRKIWVAGCKVRNGVVSRANKVKVLRKEEMVYDGPLTSLKNAKKDVTEIRRGSECGMAFGNWAEFAIGDQVQCYEEKEIKQTFSVLQLSEVPSPSKSIDPRTPRFWGPHHVERLAKKIENGRLSDQSLSSDAPFAFWLSSCVMKGVFLSAQELSCLLAGFALPYRFHAMDPLSIVAGVLGITTVVAQTSKNLYELVDGIRSAPSEIKNISRDTHAFYSILFSLESSLRDPKISAVIAEDDSLTALVGNLRDPLAHCSSVLGQMMIKIQSFVRPVDGEQWRMSSNDLKWYFGKKEILELAARVEASKATLDTGLTAVGTLCSVKIIAAGTVVPRKAIRRGSNDTDAGFALRRYAEEKDSVSPYANSQAPPSPPLEAFKHNLRLDSESSTTLQGTESTSKDSTADKLERLRRAENQRHALLSAAQSGDNLLLELALVEGADVNSKGPDGKAPMHVAAIYGNVDCIETMLDNGADIDIKQTPRGDAGARKFEGSRSPLHWAVAKGHQDVVQLLIDRGATVDAKNYTDRTPLQEAFMGSHTSIAELLLVSGASVNTKDNELWTPLHQASNNNSPLISTLLDKGCEIEAVTSNATIWTGGNRFRVATPLFLAAANGNEAAVKTLLERGANPRCRNVIGEMPIHVACWRGYAGVVKQMLDAGVGIEERDLTFDETPLIKAASTGQQLVLKLLLERGADIHAVNPYGRNALNHARLHRKTGNEEAVHFLEGWYQQENPAVKKAHQ
ncbi:MAG: hypothetical protein Q9203_005682 [Teloschistes exilis]